MAAFIAIAAQHVVPKSLIEPSASWLFLRYVMAACTSGSLGAVDAGITLRIEHAITKMISKLLGDGWGFIRRTIYTSWMDHPSNIKVLLTRICIPARWVTVFTHNLYSGVLYKVDRVRG